MNERLLDPVTDAEPGRGPAGMRRAVTDHGIDAQRGDVRSRRDPRVPLPRKMTDPRVKPANDTRFACFQRFP